MLSLYNKRKLISSVAQNYKFNAKVPMRHSSNALGRLLRSTQFSETLSMSFAIDCAFFWSVTSITSISTIITNWTLTIPSCSILMGVGAVYLRYYHFYKFGEPEFNDRSMALIVSFIIFNCFVLWLLIKSSDD